MSTLPPNPSEDNIDQATQAEAVTEPDTPVATDEQSDKGTTETSPPSPETALPPEAQGEANGGPLGCCLGVMVGLILSLIIAVVSRFYADPLANVLSSNLNTTVRILMALTGIASVIICGYFGWKAGKKLYKEYEPPVVKDRRRYRAATKSKKKQA